MLFDLKLRKIGNSVGVVLPKEALAHLALDAGDFVSVTKGTGESLRISPSKPEVSRQMKKARAVIKRYKHTLRELAK